MKNKIMFGITSLLMVLVTLCITIFATLYFVDAKSNYEIVNKLYEHDIDYYDADNKACKMINDLSELGIDGLEKYQLEMIDNKVKKIFKINEREALSVELVYDNGFKLVSYQKKVVNSDEYAEFDY